MMIVLVLKVVLVVVLKVLVLKVVVLKVVRGSSETGFTRRQNALKTSSLQVLSLVGWLVGWFKRL